ncbi:MAG TPA: ThuA domain-containing protein [Steroidobacteraceae bacterium]|nr:ThuA domain-containing protein [Steroidobacteraceae bacterium]
MPSRLNAYLVCGGKYHDMDFARLEILKLLAEHEHVRVRVGEDYRDTAAIERADFLITYTCDVIPEDAEQDALARFLESGKRWFALHGTNSVLRFVRGRGWDAPRVAPRFMQMLGSQFIAHPPIQPYRVTVADPAHPLVAGIEPFEADDELYLCEYHGTTHALLETRFTGEGTGFVESDWSRDEPRLVMYLHACGPGEVLYLTLGHCRGHYDMQPMIDYYPTVERGSWNVPVFYELLRRGIRWAGRIEREEP